jgi:hypothetical protein
VVIDDDPVLCVEVKTSDEISPKKGFAHSTLLNTWKVTFPTSSATGMVK